MKKYPRATQKEKAAWVLHWFTLLLATDRVEKLRQLRARRLEWNAHRGGMF